MPSERRRGAATGKKFEIRTAARGRAAEDRRASVEGYGQYCPDRARGRGVRRALDADHRAQPDGRRRSGSATSSTAHPACRAASWPSGCAASSARVWSHGPPAACPLPADRLRAGAGPGLPRARDVGRAVAGGPPGAPRPVPGGVDALPDDRPGRAAAAAGGGPVRRARRTRRPNRYWLVVAAGEREVCVHDPGFGDDAVVTSDVATLVAWHCGRLSLGQAQRAGMQVVATAGRRADARRLGPAEPVRRGQSCWSLVSSARMLDAPPTTSISSVPIAFSSSPAAGKA